MKSIALYTLLALSICSIAQAKDTQCPIQGKTIHWAADYCMYKSGTDDIENQDVRACLTIEQYGDADTCENRKKYKMKMCEIVKEDFDNSVEKCMADKTFSGSTVRNGGA